MRNILKIEEIEYDLAHLNPFTVNVTPRFPDAKTYKVLVSLGHHTFTREFRPKVDSKEFLHIEGGEERCFCQDRYLASKSLRRMISHNCKGKAYFSQNHNFMLLDQPLGGPPYAAFFTMQRTKNIKDIDATMFIVSAYEKPGLPSRSRLPSISFATLTHKTIIGQEIKRPKK